MDALAPAEVLLFEGFLFDRAEGSLLREDAPQGAEPLKLGSRAAALLKLLVDQQGTLVTKDEIFAAVWPGTAVEEANLTVQISALRRILDRGREHGSCIQTVPGRGYRFVAPVTPAALPTLPRANGHTAPTMNYQQTIQSNGSDPAQQRSDAPTFSRQYRLGRIAKATAAAAVCLVAAVIAALTWRSPAPWDDYPAPRLSIVVLPFANLSGDPDQQYFADALTEDLTSELARIEHMYVISHSTAMSYRDKPVGVRQIGRELGVRYVLEGGVQRSGDRMRVNTQLIDAGADTHLWADRFDRDTADLFALQNEITVRVANTLDVKLEAIEAHHRLENPDALEFILRGRAAFRKWPMEGSYAKAVGLFERALALDSHSVEAQTWLARVLVDRVLRQQSTAPAADMARAEKLADEALAASPLNWHAHYVKGQVLSAQNLCDAAIPEYRRVITLNHNFQGAYADLGWCKFWIGSLEEVIPLQVQAIRLLHADPFLSVLHWRIGVVHLVQSHVDEAVATFEKSRSINPKLVEAHAYLAAAYGLKEEVERAAAELAEARALNRDGRYSSIAQLAATEKFGVPKLRALFEETYLAGLHKAGMSEE
jgi:TolB-like protein/DNA-binding winged helix-turn-helix (wHTH) protein